MIPASSNVSRTAASQKLRPPAGMPSRALAAASSTPTTRCMARRIAILGDERAAGKDVEAAHEPRVGITPQEENLKAGRAIAQAERRCRRGGCP
jgi:hypothetical protein